MDTIEHALSIIYNCIEANGYGKEGVDYRLSSETKDNGDMIRKESFHIDNFTTIYDAIVVKAELSELTISYPDGYMLSALVGSALISGSPIKELEIDIRNETHENKTGFTGSIIINKLNFTLNEETVGAIREKARSESKEAWGA